MSESVATIQKIPKPNFRNIGYKSLLKHIYISGSLSVVCFFALNEFWYKPKYQRIMDYHRNYNPFAEMERMRQLGLFSSCPPDYILEERERKKKEKEALKAAKNRK